MITEDRKIVEGTGEYYGSDTLSGFDQRYLHLWSLGEVYGGLQSDEGAEGVYSQIIRRYFIDTQSIN